MFQKESTLIKQVYQKNTCFVTIGILKVLDLKFRFEPRVCNKSHDVLMTAYELKKHCDINIKKVYCRCILWGISRDEAVNRLNNSMLEDKGVL